MRKLTALTFVLTLMLALASCGKQEDTPSPAGTPAEDQQAGVRDMRALVVGSKHFTEQKVLGEVVAQIIEAHTPFTVRRRLGLQGTMVCFTALDEGDLDIYPEYTGTGLVNILEDSYEPEQTPEQILNHVREQFDQQYDLVWLEPLGFNNTYVYAMREDHAEELGITTISDLAEHIENLSAGFDHEYTQRPEYGQFEQIYGFQFDDVTRLAPDLTYRALREGNVDVIDAFATDGRIAAYGLRVLEDDRGLFPPYDACVVVRKDTLSEYEGLREALDKLAGRITPEKMRDMNYAVTEEADSPSEVASEFLRSSDLL